MSSETRHELASAQDAPGVQPLGTPTPEQKDVLEQLYRAGVFGTLLTDVPPELVTSLVENGLITAVSPVPYRLTTEGAALLASGLR